MTQPEALRLEDVPRIMDKPEFRVERGPAATDEAFAIGMAKLLEREGRTIAAAELRRLHHNNQVLTDALWKACGDDEEAVNSTIASQGELK